jgi:phosphoglycerate kinase
MIGLDNYNFSGKKALIRVDFNVPFVDGHVGDDTRIKAALPTIKKILADGGAVILMSHLGRPKGKDAKLTLAPVAKHLDGLIDNEVLFVNDCIGDDVKAAAANLKTGQVLLLENLRFYPEETAGDKAFAEQLASLADVFVNDAFGTAHRAHASTTIVAASFPNDKVAGYLLEKEIISIKKVLEEGKSPVLAIVGGAKVSSKLSILENLVEKVDEIIIGGGMAFTFLKSLGYAVGKSLIEDDLLPVATKFLASAKAKNVKIHLPMDVVCNTEFSNEGAITTKDVSEMADNEMGLDVGPNSSDLFDEAINRANTILWNGPMGVFEMSSFAEGTIRIAKSVANRTDAGAFSVVGGGDSVTAVNTFKLSHKVSHVSTGGGAMLECIEGKILPGIDALN